LNVSRIKELNKTVQHSRPDPIGITRALDAGADEVLAKSVNAAELSLRVKNMLRLHAQKAAERLDECKVGRREKGYRQEGFPQ